MTVPSQASAAPLSTSSPTRSAPMFFARFAAVFALFFVVLSALAIGPIPAARAADWPTYRHDINRTNASDEPLAFPLRLAWSYTCAQAPEPAWPEQLYLLNRVDFDYAPAPVVAGGLMIFGSTSDDAVHALDAATGVEKWHFITGGPVRFSPQIVGDKVYAASDDGYVYCLNASTGKAVWSFRGGPVDERLVGNHRMISRWPMRNGLLVDAGMLFCVAGTWGSEGVFVYALKAETGEVIWCRDTSGVGGMGMTDFVGMGINPQHQGEFGISGANPQGPMVANERVLIVPNGFAAPMSYDRATGKGGGVGGGPAGTGGTWLAIDGSRLYCFSKHGQRQNVLNVQDYDLVSGKAGRGWRTPAIPWLSIAPQIKPEEIHAKGKVSILAHKGNYARQAYQLAKAGAELIVGQDGYVAAETEAQKEIWRAPVEGEAREIAVADGRLYVATDRGVIYCYESAGKGGEKPAVRHDPGAAFRAKAAGAENDDSKLVSSVPGWGVKQLLASHIDRGFAMVVCDADGSVSEALAGQSQLRVINVQTDSAVAAALRERLLAETNWHGSRIHVQVVERLDKLPFAQFFANAVIVASPLDAAKGDAGAVAKELYRVLRPCGGVLVAPGLKPEQASALAAECGATDAERTAKASTKDDVKSADRPLVIRGKLPGALDWDSPKEITADQRVKWPLRPLWFGGPTSLQTHNFRQGADGPTLANGRSFIMGEDSLTAVDAYNGEVLWSRPIPKENGDIRSVDGLLFGASEAKPYGKQDFARSLRVNDDTVYLALGAAYLRGRSATIEIDARTGVQRRVYGAYIPPTPVGLASARTWPIDVDAHRSGTVTLEKTAAGLVVTLVTKNPAPANIDAWELFFDLRPFDARYGLYDHGAFHLRVTPARAKGIAATWSHGTETQYMLEYPEISVAGEAVAGGSKTVVTLPWAGLEKLEKLAGWKPSSFGFAATLNVNDGKRDEPFVRRHLFCDWAADGINNGWAKVTLDGNEDGIAGAKTQPAAAPGTQPAFAAPPTIMAAMRKFNAAALRKGGAAIAPSVANALRINPLSGEPELKVYRPSVVCGAPYFSDYMMSGRSGIYDFADDSGMRFVGGVKTRCTTPQVVALGLIMISDETGHCSCNLPFRTTLALAPAERRLNEDWAMFHDRTPDTQLRRAAINLGAPGDRRDDQGTLWLGFPRPPADKGMGNSLAAGKQYTVANPGDWLRFTPPAMQVPLEIETYGGPLAYHPEEDVYTAYGWSSSWGANRKGLPFGPNRVNPDRVIVQGTDRPWIYASSYRGIRKATLKLNFIKPVASVACDKPPALDAALAGPAWAGEPQIALPFTGTKVYLRHDAANLYLAARRPSVVNRLGAVSPWSKSTKGDDAAVWLDDSIEFFLSDAKGKGVVHLGVSASGARYDALASGGDLEDKAWGGPWKSAVVADEKGLAFELAIPWSTLAGAGLDRDQMTINLLINQRDVTGEANKYPGNLGRNFSEAERASEAMVSLGIRGRSRCEHFAPMGLGTAPTLPPRSFAVRLHFAELDDVKPGQRVFDVKIQGQTVLRNFDVLKEAGGREKAVVKEFSHIQAGDTMAVEFVPVVTIAPVGTMPAEPTPMSGPILSGLEVEEENAAGAASPRP